MVPNVVLLANVHNIGTGQNRGFGHGVRFWWGEGVGYFLYNYNKFLYTGEYKISRGQGFHTSLPPFDSLKNR